MPTASEILADIESSIFTDSNGDIISVEYGDKSYCISNMLWHFTDTDTNNAGIEEALALSNYRLAEIRSEDIETSIKTLRTNISGAGHTFDSNFWGIGAKYQDTNNTGTNVGYSAGDSYVWASDSQVFWNITGTGGGVGNTETGQYSGNLGSNGEPNYTGNTLEPRIMIEPPGFGWINVPGNFDVICVLEKDIGSSGSSGSSAGDPFIIPIL